MHATTDTINQLPREYVRLISSTSVRPATDGPDNNRERPRGLTAHRQIISVADARARTPLNSSALRTIHEGREAFREILRGHDNRTVVIAGPCSIHDTDSALTYASRLRALAAEVSDRILVLMRVYFEKPRTHVGWKGLLNDPHLDQSHALEDGILIARRLLATIADLGLPAATEFLDPLVPAYLGDAVSWVAIGARTTESQPHRQLASGLPAPVGFKNATDGGIDVAVNAIKAAHEPHTFLGIADDGHVGVVKTPGNPDTHIVLRGAGDATNWRPNYSRADIAAVEQKLRAASLSARLLLDCSHANSGYDFRRQSLVVDDWIAQRRRDESTSVFGLMLESNLVEGRQPVAPRDRLHPGISITDACIGWDETESLIRKIHAAS